MNILEILQATNHQHANSKLIMQGSTRKRRNTRKCILTGFVYHIMRSNPEKKTSYINKHHVNNIRYADDIVSPNDSIKTKRFF